MEKKVVTGFRLPESLQNEFIEFCQDTGLAQQDYLEAFIRELLNHKDHFTVDQLKSLNEQVNDKKKYHKEQIADFRIKQQEEITELVKTILFQNTRS